jgi:hypothetical protein
VPEGAVRLGHPWYDLGLESIAAGVSVLAVLHTNWLMICFMIGIVTGEYGAHLFPMKSGMRHGYLSIIERYIIIISRSGLKAITSSEGRIYPVRLTLLPLLKNHPSLSLHPPFYLRQAEPCPTHAYK